VNTVSASFNTIRDKRPESLIEKKQVFALFYSKAYEPL